MTKTIYEALGWASSFLMEHQCEPKVAEILLLDQLQWTKIDLMTRMRETMPEQAYQQFMHKVAKHAETKVPVQHITGKEFFYGREFQVNADVLIPRPETEELLEQVLTTVTKRSIDCADIGTGSGIIAITLAKEWQGDKQAVVRAVDISEKALQIARRNAEVLQAPVQFYQGDFLQPLIEKGIQLDVLVSNPPYIAYQEKEQLSETVRYHDPELALFAANNGLYAYQQIIHQARQVMCTDGMLFFEIGHTQAEAVTALIQKQFPASRISICQDINGKDRIVQALL
ncbi:peptide chain release factor N(5)-glutamine methyltransferase [Gracilibacillus alcaliphilus]|uniref:peptide chain release factor N(5)-glutamine methyltransferase n=1 Tax=Gracilibacillus alcaliphilus TaxID=1401441 RepID=UPI00195B73C5|nr:peptide chain release factor N(5)-glutamine methyltransferase [Gracilibacillus alcaliphilus]MBM7677218.1 release factor glutamine methyltransferase [Gracilibacillus alcaliphilus]